jgi:four helix bundle protein
MNPFDHSGNEVYQKALDFAQQIYSATDAISSSRARNTVQKLRSSAFSIPATIAQSSEKQLLGPRRRLLRAARGTIDQCIPLIGESFKQGNMDSHVHENLSDSAKEVVTLIDLMISRRY